MDEKAFYEAEARRIGVKYIHIVLTSRIQIVLQMGRSDAVKILKQIEAEMDAYQQVRYDDSLPWSVD
ncbi:hypothetical protein FDZ73_21300 [bacterium]|nr:MAG: hypothetical protein FDZ73_21300 [bacterium]